MKLFVKLECSHLERRDATKSAEMRFARSPSTACRFTAARAWLRAGCFRRGLVACTESIEAGVRGTRPACARAGAVRYLDLRFNVSHSDDFAVYAFASGREIGIDIESIRVIGDAADIAARFFSRPRK